MLHRKPFGTSRKKIHLCDITCADSQRELSTPHCSASHEGLRRREKRRGLVTDLFLSTGFSEWFRACFCTLSLKDSRAISARRTCACLPAYALLCPGPRSLFIHTRAAEPSDRERLRYNPTRGKAEPQAPWISVCEMHFLCVHLLCCLLLSSPQPVWEEHGQWFSILPPIISPQGTFGNVWRHFWLSLWGSIVLLAIVG